MFLIAYWNIFIMYTLKYLSDHSHISVILMLTYSEYIFFISFEITLVFDIWVTSDWSLDIFIIYMSLWILFKIFIFIGFVWHIWKEENGLKAAKWR